jgi:hypothetical protein
MGTTMRHDFDSENGARVQHGDECPTAAGVVRRSATPTRSAACESSTGDAIDDFAAEIRWLKRHWAPSGEVRASLEAIS